MDSETPPLRFRPHHFLCTVGYEGKGYSPAFVENYDSIARQLKESPNGDPTVLEVTAGTADAICAPCPHRRGEGCTTDEKIRVLDQAHSQVLGLQAGERLTWGEAKARIRERFTVEAFHHACAPCAWKAMGVCERALRALRAIAQDGSGTSGVLLLAALGGLVALPPSPARADPFALAPWGPTGSLPKTRLQVLKKLEDCVSRATTSSKPLKLDGFSSEWNDLKRYCEMESPQTSPKAKRALLWRSLEETPESPWTRRALEFLPASEITEGLSLLRKSPKSAPALRLLERASLRILRRPDAGSSATALPARTLGHFTPEVLSAFAGRCERENRARSDKPSCVWALGKLSEKFSSRSPEFQAIEKAFPKLKELTRPSPLDLPTGRLTQPSKNIEPDLVAADEAIQKYLDPRMQEEGLQKLRRFQADFARSPQRNRIRFWLLHAAEAEGRTEEAQRLRLALQQDHFFGWQGVLAWADLSQGTWLPPALEPKAPKTRKDDPLLTPYERRTLRRAQEAELAGALTILGIEIRELKPRESLSAGLLLEVARLGAKAGAHAAVFPILTELLQRSDGSMRTETARDLIFPLTDWPLIQEAAHAAQIDPVLGLSLVKQESAFDSEAVSSSGALGFSQLMPFTALDVRPGVTRSMILEPRQNLEIGFKYLRKLLDRWKGNEALALASYNAGPAAVDRWVRAMNVNPAIDPDQPLPSPREATLELAAFIDRIPYKETRDYVGSILRNIVWYRSLLPRKASFPAESASFLLPDFWRKKTAHVALPGKKSATPKTGNADTH